MTEHTGLHSQPTPMTSSDHRTVIVIGGGPGGSTAAALLATEGVDVLLLEREQFPRYHIGESLAASCRVILDLSGALPEVESFGFPVKRGALLRWGSEEDWTVDWKDLFGSQVWSWQVDRDEFDHILLRNAEKQGAEVIQRATVKRVVFEDGRAVAIEWSRNDSAGEIFTTALDYLIDASGRAGVITRQHLKCRRPHEIFRNVAIWGYWKGGERLAGTPEGGINIIASEDGWYWIIPLKAGHTSVGFVTHQDNFLERRKSFSTIEEMLHQIVQEQETVRELVRDAQYYVSARVESDFSYVSAQFCVPGAFVVGDAACFLDPLLSTGVHLAMYSSMLASAGILSIIHREVTEDRAMAFFESRYYHAYLRLLVLVSAVYDQYQGKKSYFWLAQRMVAAEENVEKPNSAFGELIAGLSDLSDAGGTVDWMKQKAIHEQAELAKRNIDERMATKNTVTGLASFQLGLKDVYDRATGLHLVTTPRLGLANNTG